MPANNGTTPTASAFVSTEAAAAAPAAPPGVAEATVDDSSASNQKTVTSENDKESSFGTGSIRDTSAAPPALSNGATNAKMTETTAGKNGELSNGAINSKTKTKPTTLLQAKVKLKAALMAKKRSLEEQLAAKVQQQPLRPVNALLKGGLDSLEIDNIQNSAPTEKVGFCQNELMLEASSNDGGDNAAKASSSNTGLDESMALTQRHVLLQQKLVEAREKRQRLEEATTTSKEAQQRATFSSGETMVEQGKDGSEATSDAHQHQTGSTKAPKPTRENLLKRKKEAERRLLENLVSKQQRLKADLDSQHTATQLEACRADLREAQTQLQELTQDTIPTLAARQNVLDALLKQHASELVEKRKTLHDYRLDRKKQH